MIACTRWRVPSATSGLLLRMRETVETDTPAARAISAIVMALLDVLIRFTTGTATGNATEDYSDPADDVKRWCGSDTAF